VSFPQRRTSLLTALAVFSAAFTLPLIATAASAAVPAPIGTAQTAARNFGNGGQAAGASVHATYLTRETDGSVLFFDAQAHQVRRVDAVTHVVTALAGNGSAAAGAARCNLDIASPATSVPLGSTAGLWTDTTGDVFLLPYAVSGCSEGKDFYRLDPVDGMWHVALKNPEIPFQGPSYVSFAVAPNGDMYVSDRHDVIRKITAGSNPASTGTVFAGTVDTPGTTGDGGQATSATLYPGTLAVGSDGAVFIASEHLRRIATDGTIATVAGNGNDPMNLIPDTSNGQPSTSVPMSFNDLAVSQDGSTVYVSSSDPLGRHIVQSFPATGGTVKTVAGPLPACGTPGHPCTGTYLTELNSQVLVSEGGSIHMWPADGSAPLVTTARYAGLDDTVATGPESPDGTRLDDAFLSITALAASKTGSYALATVTGIRTLNGLSATDTLGTLASTRVTELAYDGNGTLYALLYNPGSPSLVSISPAGVVTTLVGGGANPPAEGAVGTDVSLSQGGNVHLGVDQVSNAVYFDTSSEQLFSLDPATDVVHLVAGGLTGRAPGLLAVAADHTIYVQTLSAGLTTITPGGVVSDLDCTSACPNSANLVGNDMFVLPNGAVAGDTLDGVVVWGPDGTSSRPLPTFPSGSYAQTSDGRLVGVSTGDAGGLLTLSDVIPLPAAVDAPTVSVNPGESKIVTDITPVAGVVQRIQVFTRASGTSTHWHLADITTDGSGTPTHLESYHLFEGGGPIVHGTTYTVRVVATEVDNATQVTVSNAPQSFVVEPLVDTTAPAAPGIAISPYSGTDSRVTVTLPADADLDHVVVRKTTDGTTAATITDGADVGTNSYRYNPSLLVPVDPLKTTTFTAFAVDTAGNVSAGASASRAAALLVSGAAITHVGYKAGPNTEVVVWSEGFRTTARYAAGTVAPSTPTSGTEVGQSSSAYGTLVTVPVAKAANVAVSVFAYTDYTATAYKRTSFVLTGGTGSDVLSVGATASINPGGRPAVTATLARNSPTEGKLLLSAQPVDLYRRAVGAATWTVVAGANTTSAGTATFTVPVPAGATDYQVRYTGFAGAVAATARTTMHQLLTATLNKTSAARKTPVVVSGTLTNHRVANIQLQRYLGGRWTTVLYFKTATNGTYKGTYAPATPGAYTLRVYAPATSTLLAGNSVNRALRVT
jgi:hypothetical protein